MSMLGTRDREEEAQRALQLAQLLHTSTETMARISGLVDSVLEVWSGAFPTDGIIRLEYPVAAGAIRVRNLGEAEEEDPHHLVVSSAGPQDNRPTGLGTAIIPAGQADTVPMASRQITLYGTAGDYVAFQVYTAAERPVT